MYCAKTTLIGFATWAVLLSSMASIATAQSYFYLWDNGGGNNNWGTGTNWGPNPPLNLGVNNVTPSAWFEEMGLVNNGNTVNVTTSQTQFSSSAANNVAATAGVTVDGVVPGSTLNIASGGTLSVLTTYGPSGAPPSPTPTAGTGLATLNNTGAITVQPGGALNVGRNIVVNSGTLTVGGVAAGGQVTAGNLVEAGTNSAVNVLGSASLNLSNGAVLNGTTTITGPNVVFHTPSISMSNTTVFSPVITSAAVASGTGHSVIDVSGGVSLNGALRPQFQNGVVPNLGDVWTLFDGAQIQGRFTVSDTTAPGAALPTGLRYAITTTTDGSVRGVKGQLTVENFLTAEVDRANGQVTIRNTNTTVGPGVSIIGYQIGSAGGALNPAAFAPTFGGSWETANPTANSLGQLNTSGDATIGLGAATPLGNVYDPVALQTTFGTTPVSDVTFSYTRSDGRSVVAPVTYVNTGYANNFVLQIDPTDGKARIVNDSIFNNIQFDGYEITSAGNSLLTNWNSLEDQSLTGWEEASQTTGYLAELNPESSMTLNAGQTAAVMTDLYNVTTDSQDLVFNVRVPPGGGLPDGSGILTGVVRYEPFSEVECIEGDFNCGGAVENADLTLLLNNWAQPVPPVPAGWIGSPQPTVPAIDNDELTALLNNWGNVAGAGAASLGSPVPEPSVLVLVLVALACGLLGDWRLRGIENHFPPNQ